MFLFLYFYYTNFYPRPPRGGRPFLSALMRSRFIFLPTPSTRRATPRDVQPGQSTGDFYPRPPRGGRPTTSLYPADFCGFLPTPSTRRATETGEIVAEEQIFLPTPSTRRATLRTKESFQQCFLFLPTPSTRRATLPRPSTRCGQAAISTHALHEEGDIGPARRPSLFVFISTHALHEEGDRFPFLRSR